MKKVYIFGNAKMNMDKFEVAAYLTKLEKCVKKCNNVVGVCLPYVHLALGDIMLKKTLLGAQNVSAYDKGEYTSQVSANMLNSYNVSLCIVGHSESRKYLNESLPDINTKLKQLLNHQITPIVCVGVDKFDDIKVAQKDIIKQLKAIFKDIPQNKVREVIVAYEPIYCIGTGKSASLDSIQTICQTIRDTLPNLSIVLYGGSANEKNAQDILSLSAVNGLLVGSASLDTNRFKQIMNVEVQDENNK